MEMSRFLPSREAALQQIATWEGQIEQLLANDPRSAQTTVVKMVDPVIPSKFYNKKKQQDSSSRECVFGLELQHTYIFGTITGIATSDNVMPSLSVGLKDRTIPLQSGWSAFQEYTLSNKGPKMSTLIDRVFDYETHVRNSKTATDDVPGDVHMAPVLSTPHPEGETAPELSDMAPPEKAPVSANNHQILMSKPDDKGNVWLHLPIMKMPKPLAEAAIAVIGCSKR